MLLTRNKRRGGQLVETYSSDLDSLAELRAEVARLTGEIEKKEIELSDLSKKRSGLAHSFRLAAGYAGEDSPRAGSALAGVESTEKEIRILTDDLFGLRSDLARAEKMLDRGITQYERDRAKTGEQEIRAKLAELLPAIENAKQLNQEYMLLRRSFNHAPGRWPFWLLGNFENIYLVDNWIDQVKRFLETR